MKRKMMTLAALACAGALALSWNNLRAQTDSTAPATTPPASLANPAIPSGVVAPAPAPVPGQPPGPPGRLRGQRPFVYQRALMVLQQTKTELERATDDFGGHRQPALDACDKAITELTAVMKAAGIRPMMPRPPRPMPSPQPAPLQQPASPPSAPPQ